MSFAIGKIKKEKKFSLNMENKRGVSPVIATVLLIAMVIVLGLIIFLWFKSFTKEAITKFDGENVELVCGDVAFSSSYSGGTLYISNDGAVPIYSLKAKVYTGGDSNPEAISGIDGKLNPGKAFSTAFNIGTADKVILSPILLGATENGQKTFACDEKKYGREVIL